MAPRISLAAAGPGQRLIHVLHGQDAEAAGHARGELDLHETARALAADVVVVRRLAADDRAEGRDARVVAGLGAVLRRQRQLIGAGDVIDVDLTAVGLEDRASGGHELLGQVGVEAPHDDRVALLHESRSWRCSETIISSSRLRPWWCSVWPMRSFL